MTKTKGKLYLFEISIFEFGPDSSEGAPSVLSGLLSFGACHLRFSVTAESSERAGRPASQRGDEQAETLL